MTVTFIAHSSFLVEWDAFYTLFDFWKGDLPALRPDKPLLVFASHSHEDHFDPRIFRLLEQYPDTTYFLSHDIRLATRRWEKLGVTRAIYERVTSLRPDSLLATQAGGAALTIRTVHSTDVGVAFLLSAEGKLLYHAGDNNWWHWEEEGRQYCANMAAAYRRSIESLAASVRDEAADAGTEPLLTAAMVPLDPRLEDAFGLGAEYLLRTVPTRALFPMHMWDKFDWADRFRREHPDLAGAVVPIRRDGEVFAL